MTYGRGAHKHKVDLICEAGNQKVKVARHPRLSGELNTSQKAGYAELNIRLVAHVVDLHHPSPLVPAFLHTTLSDWSNSRHGHIFVATCTTCLMKHMNPISRLQ